MFPVRRVGCQSLVQQLKQTIDLFGCTAVALPIWTYLVQRFYGRSRLRCVQQFVQAFVVVSSTLHAICCLPVVSDVLRESVRRLRLGSWICRLSFAVCKLHLSHRAHSVVKVCCKSPTTLRLRAYPQSSLERLFVVCLNSTCKSHVHAARCCASSGSLQLLFV